MARELVDVELWEFILPLIPVGLRRKTHPGRKPLGESENADTALIVAQA